MKKHCFNLPAGAFVTIALLCSPITLWAQTGQPVEVRKAQALIQAKDYDGAIKVLEDFLKANPTRPAAWNLLGTSYARKGDYDKALKAYGKAMASPQFRSQSLYNSACVYALKNDKEEALKLLGQLRKSGSFDMSVIMSDEDLKNLRTDPRFDKLIPRPEEFADPFVEKVKTIHEWTGEAKGDQFGWIARRIGDVDRDHVHDFVTSAPTHSIEGNSSGRVYVYSGKDGKLLLTLGSGDLSETFGRHVSGAGDINGDGHSDVIVGAPGNSSAGQGAGRAYVYSGKDGAVLLTLDGEKAGDAFGSAVAGYADKRSAFLIAGAPNAGPKNTGRVYVYSGLTNKPKFIIDADETGAQLGAMFLSVVGDVNKDKTPDIYASDFANSAKGNATGRVYVHSGADGRRLLTLTGEGANDGFGIGPADAGDVNKDGYDDLIVGAWQHSGAAGSGGKVYLYSGKEGSLIRAYTCRIPGDTFGFDATGIGDVDGHGVIDFLFDLCLERDQWIPVRPSVHRFGQVAGSIDFSILRLQEVRIAESDRQQA